MALIGKIAVLSSTVRSARNARFDMKKRYLALAAVAALLAFSPAPAFAADTQTYDLIMEAPSLGVAPSGDVISVTGEGEFSVHPKSVHASGELEHTDAAGNVVGTGTWTANDLISFHPYGCGIIVAFDVVLPPNFCGGALKMAVTIETPLGTFDGILTVFCIIGEHAPASHSDETGEGVTLLVPGIINFNHTAGGENLYIKQ